MRGYTAKEKLGLAIASFLFAFTSACFSAGLAIGQAAAESIALGLIAIFFFFVGVIQHEDYKLLRAREQWLRRSSDN